jgi:hypothetical protein
MFIKPLHHESELCLEVDGLLLFAVLPTGQITNHYKLEDWDLFKIPETEKALVNLMVILLMILIDL